MECECWNRSNGDRTIAKEWYNKRETFQFSNFHTTRNENILWVGIQIVELHVAKDSDEKVLFFSLLFYYTTMMTMTIMTMVMVMRMVMVIVIIIVKTPMRFETIFQEWHTEGKCTHTHRRCQDNQKWKSVYIETQLRLTGEYCIHNSLFHLFAQFTVSHYPQN